MRAIEKTVMFITVVAISAQAASAADYCVLKGASGARTGVTWTDAWDDLGEIRGLAPGDTVYLAAGIYTNNFTLMADGLPAARIAIRRATTTLHGPAGGWSPAHAGHVRISAMIDIKGHSNFTIDGGDQTALEFDGLSTVGNAITTAYSSSEINRSHDLTIANLTIHHYRNSGLRIFNTTGAVIVEGVEIYKCGDTSNEASDANIALTRTTAFYGANELRGCFSHEFGYMPYNATNFAAICDLLTVSGEPTAWNIHDNTFVQDGQWNGRSSADHISLRTSGIRVFNNTFYDRNAGANQMVFIEVDAAATSSIERVHIFNNLFFSDGPNEGAAIRAHSKSQMGPYAIRELEIYNNTIYAMGYGIQLRQSSLGTWGRTVIKNNIIYSSSAGTRRSVRGIMAEPEAQTDLTLDYNYYVLGSDAWPNVIQWGATDYTLDAFRQFTSQELHGATGTVMFDRIATDGFHLAPDAGFPLHLGGTNLSSIFTTDKGGNVRDTKGPWDLGAFIISAPSNTPAAPLRLRPSPLELHLHD